MKLPLADAKFIWHSLKGLIGQFKREFSVVIALQLGASLAAVVLPWILGDLIDAIGTGTTASYIVRSLAICLAFVLIGAILSYFAEYRARVMGESVFAVLREQLVETVTSLPLSTVESAGTGDLLGRTTRDVERVQFTVRMGISSILVLTVTIVVTVAAAIMTSPLLSVGLLIPIPFIYLVMRWYLPRTIPAYRANAAAWANVSGVITETVEYAETVDAASLRDQRNQRLDGAFREVWRLERYAAWQRMTFMFWLVFSMLFPIALVVAFGAYLYSLGWVTAGQVSTVALYLYQLRNPVWEATFWIDEIQSAAAALARIFGVGLVPPGREPTGQVPSGSHLVARDVTYAYREGQNVLHGVSLDLRGGETLAMVGPSGAGKSTFGRMLAGIHPPSSGSVTVGGVNLVDLTEDELQKQVILVNQEHHVFVGTIADNIRMAKGDATAEEIEAALEAVDAMRWIRDLPEGVETRVGAGGLALNPAQAQQVALARIILLNPHTLVLDEATSLMDPTAARDLERSLARVLAGRTVVAIAHRLYTAHDADRVAVLQDGRLVELGSHDELVARGGEYASLWESWQKG